MVEQDADIVMFVYRDEVYDRETKDRGIAEVIIAKQRNGPCDTVRLRFVLESTRFEDVDAGERDTEPFAPRASMVHARSPGPVSADDVLDRYGAGDGLPGAVLPPAQRSFDDVGEQYEEGAA